MIGARSLFGTGLEEQRVLMVSSLVRTGLLLLVGAAVTAATATSMVLAAAYL